MLPAPTPHQGTHVQFPPLGVVKEEGRAGRRGGPDPPTEKRAKLGLEREMRGFIHIP